MSQKPTRQQLEKSNRYYLIKEHEQLFGNIYYVSKFNPLVLSVTLIEGGLSSCAREYPLFNFYRELVVTPKGNKIIACQT